jgi:S1-C subfamily serine protease
MAGKKTLYQILGVDANATAEEINQAFQALKARLAGGQADANALVFAREAHHVLSDANRRAAYDASLAAPLPPQSLEDLDEPSAVGEWLRSGAVKWVAGLAIVGSGAWFATRPSPPSTKVVMLSPPVVLAPSERDDGASTGAAPAAGAPDAGEAAAPAPSAAAPGGGAEDVFSQVSRSVATVLIRDGSGRTIGNGSGVAIEPNVVITNCHVAMSGSELTVKLGEESHAARLEIGDEEFDLCRLAVPGLGAQPATVGEAGTLRVGQRVFAVGAPQGLELTLSDGIVSSLRDVGEDGRVIQTTAPVSPGSSGGGLFDASGRLVGIVTFQHRYGQNLNFAVPAEWISRMRQRRASGADVRRAAAPTGVEASDAPADLILGTWGCYGSISGRNGEHTYEPDGTVTIVPSEGRPLAGRYVVAGRSVRYAVGDEQFVFAIEEITRSRLLLHVGGGQRLVCERG